MLYKNPYFFVRYYFFDIKRQSNTIMIDIILYRGNCRVRDLSPWFENKNLLITYTLNKNVQQVLT